MSAFETLLRHEREIIELQAQVRFLLEQLPKKEGESNGQQNN